MAGIDSISVSLTSVTGARSVIDSMAAKLQILATLRSNFGVTQSRLEVTLNNLAQTVDNYEAAADRLGDADMAAEVANLVRAQILQQATNSLLLQANQQPSLALQLLGS